MPIHEQIKAASGLGTLEQVSQIHAWILRLRNTVDHDSRLLIGAAQALADLIENIGWKRWARYWHYGRSTISLQHRLFAEQVYSDLGEPWSRLVTGFGAIGFELDYVVVDVVLCV